MKKKKIMILGTIILIMYLIMLVPRDFNRTYEGVKYRLGDSDKSYIEQVTIQFKGEIFRNLKLNEKFRGKLRINDFEIPLKESNKESFTMDFGYHDWIIIDDIYLDGDASLKRTLYGDLYMNRSRTKLSIVVSEDGKWSSNNGLVISAPSDTRKEALIITNELLEHMLNEDFTQFK